MRPEMLNKNPTAAPCVRPAAQEAVAEKGSAQMLPAAETQQALMQNMFGGALSLSA